MARVASTESTTMRNASGNSTGAAGSIGSVSGPHGCRQMNSQNARSRSIRRSGGLPAITAAFRAPIEMPATQFGWIPASASPSYTPA